MKKFSAARFFIRALSGSAPRSCLLSTFFKALLLGSFSLLSINCFAEDIHVQQNKQAIDADKEVTSNSSVWKDSNGNALPDTDFQKSLNDFGGMLLLTSDLNWKEKWEAPAESRPQFKQVDSLYYGDTIVTLLFFVNAKANEKNKINLSCDIHITKPDGSDSINMKDVSCADWEAPSEEYKYNIQLSKMVINFVGEVHDPAGTWIIRIKLKDNNSGTMLPLKTSFTLKERPAE